MKNKGFTLLEITVVIVIIIFLSTIFVINYRGGEKQFALKRSAHKLAQDLRGAQEMALAGQEFKGIFQGGYGIHFTVTPETEKTGEYTLFVDCKDLSGSDNKVFDSVNTTCDDCTGNCVDNILSEEVEIISLEEGIYISELSPSLSGDPLSILFFPPDPTVTINGDPIINSASITLTFDGQSTKTVSVNKAGLIEVE